jgi:hypothetical protein
MKEDKNLPEIPSARSDDLHNIEYAHFSKKFMLYDKDERG